MAAQTFRICFLTPICSCFTNSNYLEDRSSTLFRNVGTHTPTNTSPHTGIWENSIIIIIIIIFLLLSFSREIFPYPGM